MNSISAGYELYITNVFGDEHIFNTVSTRKLDKVFDHKMFLKFEIRFSVYLFCIHIHLVNIVSHLSSELLKANT